MNKSEFVKAVGEKAGIKRGEAKKVVDVFIQTVEEAISAGEKVTLLGFGSFVVAEKAARKGINPKTKSPIVIPARKCVKFKPSDTFANVVK